MGKPGETNKFKNRSNSLKFIFITLPSTVHDYFLNKNAVDEKK